SPRPAPTPMGRWIGSTAAACLSYARGIDCNTTKGVGLDTRAGLPTDGSTADQASAKVQLKVVHGHLAFAKHPVLVGHYNGDTFAGAEAQLDRALERRLSQRRSLGLYPGPLGTNTIVLDDTQRPCGAVVVGLGEATNLSLGGLRRTLRQGI